MAISTDRPIRSDKELDAVLREIDTIFDAVPGSAEFDRLEVFTLLAIDYESKHHPIDPPDPIEAIKFRMDQGNLTRKDLETALGGRNRVSEVLSGKRRLTLEMIRALHSQLGIPAESLIGDTKRHKTDSVNLCSTSRSG